MTNKLSGKVNRIYDQMKDNGVGIGEKLEITLVDGVHFNTRTTTIPTYHKATKKLLADKPSKKTFSGYVAAMNENDDGALCLVLGWDHDRNEMAEQGYLGAVKFDFDTIANYSMKII
jgi:hypothetical protein